MQRNPIQTLLHLFISLQIPMTHGNAVWTPLRCWLLACNDGWPQWL